MPIVLTLTAGLGACGGGGGGGGEARPATAPGPSTPVPAPRGAAPAPREAGGRGLLLLVKDRPTFTAFTLGDTVAVDASRLDDWDELVPVTGRGRDRGAAVAGLWLGPLEGPVVVTSDGLNMRACPSTECGVVGTLARGDTVRVKGYSAGWYRVDDLPEPGAGADQPAKSLTRERFLAARFVVLPEAFDSHDLQAARLAVQEHVEGRLTGLRTAEGDGPLVSGFDMELDGPAVSLTLSVASGDDEAVARVCEALPGVRDVAAGLVSSLADRGVSTYRVDVRTTGLRGRSVARINPEEGVLCGGGVP